MGIFDAYKMIKRLYIKKRCTLIFEFDGCWFFMFKLPNTPPIFGSNDKYDVVNIKTGKYTKILSHPITDLFTYVYGDKKAKKIDVDSLVNKGVVRYTDW